MGNGQLGETQAIRPINPLAMRPERADDPAMTAAAPRVTVLLTCLVLAGTALSQEPEPARAPASQTPPSQTPPSQDPSLTDPSVGEDLLDQERQRPAPKPVEPDAAAPGQRVIPSVPGVDRLSFAMPNRKFRTEGAYVTRVTGSVVKLPTGEHVFLPAVPSDGTPADQPMLLMPSQRLSQIQSVTESAEAVEMALSGQAFVYRGRQYLLPSTFSLINAARPARQESQGQGEAERSAAGQGAAGQGAAEQGAGAAPASSGPKPDAAAAPSGDPRVDDLIRDLETRSRGQRLLAPPVDTADAVQGQQAAEQANLLPEGDLITNRRGRLVRLAGSDGRFALVFDNDPNSPGTGPLVILPCRVLETMEGLAMPRGDEASFRVSGRVLVYEGRNYLLPTLAQLERAGELTPLQ